MRYAAGELLLHAASITLSGDAGSTTLAGILNLFDRVDNLEGRIEKVEEKV